MPMTFMLIFYGKYVFMLQTMVSSSKSTQFKNIFKSIIWGESIFHLELEGTGTSSFFYQGGHVGFTEVKELALGQGQ